jgi:hypothetical protein
MKPSNRLLRIIRIISVGLFALIAAVVCIALAILKRPVIYKISDNYKGWVTVKYDDSSCPPLRREYVFLVIPVNASGIGCTSSPLQAGWRITLFEYTSGKKVIRKLRQSGWGGDGEIWAGFTMPYKHAESFFVGAEKELNQSWSQRPK